MLNITIPLNPITKKNSPRLFDFGRKCYTCGRRQHTRIMPSKQYMQYEKSAGHYLKNIKAKEGLREPIKEPCEVMAVFYMQTRRRVDLTNLLEAVDDVLVKYGILEDDNCKIIKSHDGSRVDYDKTNPRTEITIRKMEK